MGRHRAGNEARDGSALKDRSAVGESEAKGTAADAAAVPLPADSGLGLRPRRTSGRRLKDGSQRSPAVTHDLLGWGLFLTVTAAAAMLWAGIDWPVIAAAGLLLLLSFTAVWYVSSAPAAVTPQKVPVAELRAVPSEAPAPVPAPADASAVPATSPALSPVSSPVSPMTRKQMRAADPSTGLLPVVSVFARKPDAASVALPARSASGPAAEAPVPQAPAGQLLQGIDAGTTAPDSRRARRAAGRGTVTGANSGAGKAVAKTNAALPAAAAADPQSPSGGGTAPESRWTRTFGPPETGQLPIQQYVAAATALDTASSDRQQRSHSSL